MLLKRILEVPCSTPTALLYLELGITPLKYIIQARRIMFLHYILTRKKDDLLLSFFLAQLREPTNNDWCSQVKKDLDDLNIEDNFDNIKIMTKTQLSSIVKEAYKSKAFEDLLEQQLRYSKGEELVYGELNMRRYLKTKSINLNQAKIIFKFRSRMINVKGNFKGSHQNDMSCPLGCLGEPDSQMHLIFCDKLPGSISESEFSCIFGENEDKMEKVIPKLERKLDERRNILDV